MELLTLNNSFILINSCTHMYEHTHTPSAEGERGREGR